MLVVTRKTDQRILIGRDITVTIVRIQGQRVKIGIEAPSGIRVCRDEILHRASEAGGPGSPRPAIFSSSFSSSPDSPHRGPGRRPSSRLRRAARGSQP